MTAQSPTIAGVEIRALPHPAQERVLAREALSFAVDLHRRFDSRRVKLLAARAERQKRLDAGEKPDFLPGTRQIRESEWTVAPIPKDLEDRRVEITGPVDRKMVINALNSGAKVFMADFEDSNTPTWANLIEGHVNLADAVRRTISHVDPQSGKAYSLNPRTAVLLVRPRGFHLEERHVLVDGTPMSGSLFDFGLYFFHNAKALIASGSGPYFYLPKIESHLEAQLWNDVFAFAQKQLGIAHGTIRATVLIETILASFEMDEILYELRDHSAGLNCGRWDYIFSFIKKFSRDPRAVFPDRARVTMTSHFLRSYSMLLIRTCHRRNIHAMGGMAAFIPIKNDPAANETAMAQVRADKEREAGDGYDGTWVAHPGLVQVAQEIFDRFMPRANQIDKKLLDFRATAADLLQVPQGEITEAGVRQNIAVGLGYLEAWLRGIGCVPLFNLMEDAATAEISRAQLWQWVHHGAVMKDGRTVDQALCDALIDEELGRVERGGEKSRIAAYRSAAGLMRDMIRAPEFVEFLTLPAYRTLLKGEGTLM
ncbi:MAG TPA: malate synthase A [Vicinamibacteria bacterium]|jgi:malate synthase|nr:malate synthase A [Vicinamibacteria bacterium]